MAKPEYDKPQPEDAEPKQPQRQESPASTSLRMRTEQELDERRAVRAAEDYAPPAGVGVVVDPDERWRAENPPAS